MTIALKVQPSPWRTSFTQPGHLALAWLWRLWWHTRAYSTVLGIMVLVVLSLIFLKLYGFFSQLVEPSRRKMIRLFRTV